MKLFAADDIYPHIHYNIAVSKSKYFARKILRYSGKFPGRREKDEKSLLFINIRRCGRRRNRGKNLKKNPKNPLDIVQWIWYYD